MGVPYVKLSVRGENRAFFLTGLVELMSVVHLWSFEISILLFPGSRFLIQNEINSGPDVLRQIFFLSGPLRLHFL